MLVDANILLYAVDESSSFHQTAASWLTEQLNGVRRVGLPWLVLGAFLRISTHPRASKEPLTPDQAWGHVTDWLACEPAWVPGETERHADVLGSLVRTHQPRGNLITDAQIAALAIEHGLTICSTDTDFARFTEARWENPLPVRQRLSRR
jgi:toxin-antitoxin system PIN domain toxin